MSPSKVNQGPRLVKQISCHGDGNDVQQNASEPRTQGGEGQEEYGWLLNIKPKEGEGESSHRGLVWQKRVVAASDVLLADSGINISVRHTRLLFSTWRAL